MTNENLYLKQNVLMEPLVDQWYAWAHLISPATAAMNISDPIDRKKDRTRRLAGSKYERGMAIIDELNPKEVYVYAMGQEPC
jgi:hypothetical protein